MGHHPQEGVKTTQCPGPCEEEGRGTWECSAHTRSNCSQRLGVHVGDLEGGGSCPQPGHERACVLAPGRVLGHSGDTPWKRGLIRSIGEDNGPREAAGCARGHPTRAWHLGCEPRSTPGRPPGAGHWAGRSAHTPPALSHLVVSAASSLQMGRGGPPCKDRPPWRLGP